MLPIKWTSTAQGLFKMGPGTEPWLRYAQRLQKCLGPCRHSSEKGCLRYQVIKLSPPRRVRAWWWCRPKAHGGSAAWHEYRASPAPSSGSLDRVTVTVRGRAYVTPLTIVSNVFMKMGHTHNCSPVVYITIKLIVTLKFYQKDHGFEIIHEVWYAIKQRSKTET